MPNLWTPDDVTTTATLEVWRDKLSREERSRDEWHHRFGNTFGLPEKVSRGDPQWRPLRTPPDLPPPGRAPQLVEPTASALRWDSAIARNNVPIQAASVASSKRSAVSLPSMRTVSVSSSADRRRELLVERHNELQAQLQLVEQMLNQAKPSTMLSTMSAVSATSAASAASRASRAESERSSGSQRSQRRTSASRLYMAQPEPEPPRTPLGPIPELADIMPPRAPAEYGAVPLMLDRRDPDYKTLSPFHSKATAGLALPGSALSGASPRQGSY